METQKEIINDKNVETEKNWFSSTGRIGRGEFLFRNIAILMLVGLWFFLLTAMTILHHEIFNDNSLFFLLPIMWLIPIISGLILLYLKIVQDIKRLHDLGYSGLRALLLLVPVANFILTIYLFFVKGNSFDNEYGKVEQKAEQKALTLAEIKVHLGIPTLEFTPVETDTGEVNFDILSWTNDENNIEIFIENELSHAIQENPDIMLLLEETKSDEHGVCYWIVEAPIQSVKKEMTKIQVEKSDKEIRTNEKSETILTEKEKETSNKYREELSLYRDMLIFDKTINVEHLKAMYPTINESTLQQLKDGSKITQEEKLAGFPYLIYCHACDRLEITPFNQDNVFASVDNDDNMISSLKKAVEHSNAIGTLKNAITGCLDNLIKLTDNEKEFDILFCGLIDIVADLLVKK